MKTSKEGLSILIEREGKRSSVYLDSVGVPTVGIGHTGPDVRMGDTWDDARIINALQQDICWVEAAINNNVRVPLEQHQYDALASWIFNIGQGAFLSSTLLRLLNEGKINEVPAQFDRWNKPPEIISRRNGEREQFKGAAFQARIA